MLTSSHLPSHFLPLFNHSKSPISSDLHTLLDNTNMGLSSKQVSSSGGFDWNDTLLEAQNLELNPKPHDQMKKQQQQQTEQSSSESLKCPRCDSTNTKFCYYNNYNKSQPRHFCRACKRHWTKGGTLRNVPVGGGRKNKRVKKSTTSTSSTTTKATTSTCTNMNIQTPLDQKNIALIGSSSLLLQQNMMNMRDLESKDFGIGNGTSMSMSMSLSSTLALPQNQSLLFPVSTTSSSFDTNPCSVSSSLRSFNVYNYGEEFKTMEDTNTTINSVIPSTSGTNTQHWEIPATGGDMQMSNYWSWEDIDSLVSTDLKDPWDDSDIKP